MYSLLQLTDTSEPPTSPERPAPPGLLLGCTLPAPPPGLLIFSEAEKSRPDAPKGLLSQATNIMLAHIHAVLPPLPPCQDNSAMPSVPSLLWGHCAADGQAVKTGWIWTDSVNNGLKLSPHLSVTTSHHGQSCLRRLAHPMFSYKLIDDRISGKTTLG